MKRFCSIQLPIIFISLILLQSCNNKYVIPDGYYQGKVVEFTYDSVVQVKSAKGNTDLDNFNYIYISNLPKELSDVGSVFYFKGYNEIGFLCLADRRCPEIAIEVTDLSSEKPK